jgi:aldehyde dehydrogenase (NAD+)/aldehyde dehydrogenase
MFALNQGEICTNHHVLVHEDIDLFIERMQARLKLVKAGNPLDPETMIGSQVSKHNAIKSLTISILVKKKVQLY